MWKTVSFGAALFLLVSCSEHPPNYPPRPVPAGLLKDPSSITAGKRLFLSACARCHGYPSEGRSARANFFQPPAPDFSETRYRQTAPDYLYWRIEKGKTVEPFLSAGSVMPAWGLYLSEKQIWQLVAYIESRGAR